MTELDVVIDEELNGLVDRGQLQPAEAIAIQTLRETQELAKHVSNGAAKKNETPPCLSKVVRFVSKRCTI